MRASGNLCVRSRGAGVVMACGLAMAVAAPGAVAQTEEEQAVRAVVERLFEGMLARDTAKMRETMSPVAQLLGRSQDGQTLRWGSVDGFLQSVARGQGPGANERIYNPEIRIDGELAAVWTFYTLHVGERFIHCGYDAFHLARTDAGWKIVSIADTRRTENCEPPRGPI
ncbi:MAG: nuclear transport factor 2 family protein [Longimicrobiales bacterium]